MPYGSEAGSDYPGKAALTRDNALAAPRAIASDGERAVSGIVYTDSQRGLMSNGFSIADP